MVVLHHEIGSLEQLPFHDELAVTCLVYRPTHPGYDGSTRPDWLRNVRDLAVLYHWPLGEQGLEGATLDLGGDCMGDGIAKLVFTILSGVAEFERYRTRERILEVVADRRKRGLPFGGVRPAFGFEVGAEGRLQPVPKEQRAIRLLKHLHAKGHSLREIAQLVQQRHGVKISHATVAAVLNRASPAPKRA